MVCLHSYFHSCRVHCQTPIVILNRQHICAPRSLFSLCVSFFFYTPFSNTISADEVRLWIFGNIPVDIMDMVFLFYGEGIGLGSTCTFVTHFRCFLGLRMFLLLFCCSAEDVDVATIQRFAGHPHVIYTFTWEVVRTAEQQCRAACDFHRLSVILLLY